MSNETKIYVVKGKYNNSRVEFDSLEMAKKYKEVDEYRYSALGKLKIYEVTEVEVTE